MLTQRYPFFQMGLKGNINLKSDRNNNTLFKHSFSYKTLNAIIYIKKGFG